LFLATGIAAAQPFSGGIKAGLPLTGLLDNLQPADTTAVTRRYLVGPEVEVRLLHGLSIELDALYRHFSYTHVDGYASSTITTIGSSGSWELPLVGKYRFPGRIVKPYVEGGVAWDFLSGVNNTSSSTPCSQVCENTNYPPTVESHRTPGAVIGGGIDLHAGRIRIAPEIRFTHWTQKYFALDGDLSSRQNQVEFLIGFTF